MALRFDHHSAQPGTAQAIDGGLEHGSRIGCNAQDQPRGIKAEFRRPRRMKPTVQCFRFLLAKP